MRNGDQIGTSVPDAAAALSTDEGGRHQQGLVR